MPAGSEVLAQLREHLERAGYDEATVDQLVRADRALGFDQGLAALRLRPEADEPLTVLVRLFLGRERLSAATVASALGPVGIDALARAGVVGVRDGSVRARVALQPYAGLLVASDRSGGRPRADHVLEIGPATRTLASLTVRRQVEATLDLATGSGLQALLAAAHSERVVGLDLSRRALRLARLTAELNGVQNVEWRQGDLYAPVRDERFGLLTANPPFVISPVQELVFRDGGRGGDALSHESVTGAAEHLDEGGFATVLCSWVVEPGEPHLEPVRRWLEGSGCDLLLLELWSEDPVTYAVSWNNTHGRSPAAAAAAAEPWLADYRARGIRAISTGAAVLRKRGGRTWARFDELALAPRGAAGAHLERIFDAQDFLERPDAEALLLTLTLAPAPGTARVERRLASGELEQLRLTVDEGLPFPGRVPLEAAPVLAALDGRQPLREVVAAEAVAAGVSAEGLAAQALPAVQVLFAKGLLVTTR